MGYSWHSPQSIFHVGHRAAQGLFNVEVQVQEKIDGSFFAWGYYPEAPDEQLKLRSKGAVMYKDAPQKMFQHGVDTVNRLYKEGLLHPGWMYRGEYLMKPKHNALAYDRIPEGHVVLFDICTDEETYLPYLDLFHEARRLGLEVVPQLSVGKLNGPNDLRLLLDTTSMLGGQKIEGVVVKPIEPLYGIDKKLLMAKFVSEAFKETHARTWGEANPKSGDILDRLGARLGTQARWMKAVQHLREAGKIEDSPRDIGPILREVWPDIVKEEKDAILEDLWSWVEDHLKRKVTAGLPEWYKNTLIEKAFEEKV